VPSSSQRMFSEKQRQLTYNCMVWAYVLVALFPVLWMVSMAFKPQNVMFSIPTAWFFSPTLGHFSYVLEEGFIRNIGTSLIVSCMSTVLVVIVGTPAAYAFARFRIWRSNDLFLFILATRMAPPVALVIPFYLIYAKIGILGSYTGLILAYLTFNLSFYVWVLRSFCRETPIELEEAAMADGYSRWQVLVKIVLPLLRPGIIATSVLCFIFTWNEFIYAFMLGGRKVETIPTVIPHLITAQGVRWGELSIVGMVALLPVLVVVFLLQRHIIRGLTMGAVKG
jgi:multiple sugar transport system permease protein